LQEWSLEESASGLIGAARSVLEQRRAVN